ncbi:transaldolase B [Fusarium subglutinans]|uniref:Transaldolase B n=1 Tax=Gibberella subglutinans TaxID=42677 RepID=A0A8H5Q4B3_GIBSU|nr:transaldolase B [Fusarium subglutinans]KAF5609265.1 transaldolase B [Fusarium subglutinans]
MSKVTWLDKLQEQVNIDIDCMDPAEAKRFLPFKPHDQTSNQRLVYEQIISPENRGLFLKTVEEGKDEGWEIILDRMSALLCAKNIDNIQGRVLLQTSAFHAYDTGKVVSQARSYAREFEKLGISKDRICIKIPCTGPALNASPILLKEGIRTLGTSLFSVAQAIAASQAKTLSISPYYNFPWYHTDREQWPNTKDPALEHPMSPRIVQIQHIYKRLREETGEAQPQLKPASFISAREAMAVAELGCDHATIPEDILLQLSLLDAEASPPPGSDTHRKIGTPSQRLAHLAKVDPLAGPDWSGLPALDIDYLADNGAALTEAITADTVTKRGLDQALEAFKANELQSREAIEEALKQF